MCCRGSACSHAVESVTTARCTWTRCCMHSGPTTHADSMASSRLPAHHPRVTACTPKQPAAHPQPARIKAPSRSRCGCARQLRPEPGAAKALAPSLAHGRTIEIEKSTLRAPGAPRRWDTGCVCQAESASDLDASAQQLVELRHSHQGLHRNQHNHNPACVRAGREGGRDTGGWMTKAGLS